MKRTRAFGVAVLSVILIWQTDPPICSGGGGGIGGGGGRVTRTDDDSGRDRDEERSEARHRRSQRAATRQREKLDETLADAQAELDEGNIYNAYRKWLSARRIDDSAEAKSKLRTFQSELIRAAREALIEADDAQHEGDAATAIRLRRDVSRMTELREAAAAREALMENKEEINALALINAVDAMLAVAEQRLEAEAAANACEADPCPGCDKCRTDAPSDETAEGADAAGQSSEDEAGDPEADADATDDEAAPPSRNDIFAALSEAKQQDVIGKLRAILHYYEETQTAREAEFFLSELEADERFAEILAAESGDDDASEAEDGQAEPPQDEPRELKLARMYRKGGLYDKAKEYYAAVIETCGEESVFGQIAAAERAEVERLQRQAELEAEAESDPEAEPEE